MATNKDKEGPEKVEWDAELGNGKTIHIVYQEADDIDSEEGHRKLNHAYEILFEEVLRRRKNDKSAK